MKLGELIREEVLGVAERINLSLGLIRLDCSEFEVPTFMDSDVRDRSQSMYCSRDA